MLGPPTHVASLLLLVSLLSVSVASPSGQQLLARRFGSFGLVASAEKSCTENYGFLPCSDKVGGSLFLLAIYTYIFVKAAQLLLNGSELLLEVVHPGIVGGLCLPVFCTIPDAAVILVSGITGDKETAQDQVMIGMGVLAGSTVLLLTLLWGAALVVGRCDLYELNGTKVAKSKMLTRGFFLTETGVSTNRQTSHVAWIMVMSITPCVVVQLPQMLGLPALRRAAVIGSCVLAFVGFICYCIYQVMTPWIQQSMIDWHRHRFRRSHVLHRAHIYSRQNKWGDLLLNDGKLLNYDVLRRLFHFFDTNNDGQLSLNELQSLIQSLSLKRDENMSEDQAARQWMQEFDMTRDGKLSLSEFEQGMANWLSSSQLQNEFVRRQSFRGDRTVSGHWEEIAKEAHSSLTALLEEEDTCSEQPNEPNCENDDMEEVDEEEEPEPSRRWILTSAIASLIAGAALACFFSAPLIDSISSFSEASNISSFFISFVISPLATSSSEALSSIAFATKKQRRSISVTYSQLYGSVILNNTLCLGLFLAIIAARGLVWNYSAEVMIMGLVTAAMGCIGGLFTTLPLGLALAAFSGYPASLALVSVLNKVCGWR